MPRLTDKQFEDAFATARVSKGYLARYYLRALDKTLNGEADPEFVANEDYDATNLEHIIPLTPGPAWKLSADEASSLQTLIGNLTLMSARKNVEIGNASFADKVKVYKESAYKITNTLEGYQATFGADEIKKR